MKKYDLVDYCMSFTVVTFGVFMLTITYLLLTQVG